MALLQQAHRQFFARHPLQLALAVLGIAIGVAAAVAVDLSVSSARLAFQSSMNALLGSTTHQLVASGSGIDESLYPILQREFPEIRFTPVVDGIVEAAGETFRVTGFDVAAAPTGAHGQSRAGLISVLPELLSQPGAVLVSRVSAEQSAIRIGQSLVIRVGGIDRLVHVLGTIEGTARADPALEGLLVADIATAQELLGKIGTLDRFDLELPPDAEIEQRLAGRLPANIQLVTAAGRTRGTQRLSSAFETNLLAMSMLGLVVGLFLIYNTMTFAVVQRREMLGTLRLLGSTRAETVSEILLEALWLGVVGGALGLGLGIASAEFLVDRVTQTINDVYFSLTVRQLTIAPAVLLRGLMLGLAASLMGAAVPAWEAARASPLAARSRSRLEESSRVWGAWAAGAGALAVGAAFLLLFGFRPGLTRGIAGVFLLLAGCGLMIPATVGYIARWLERCGAGAVRLAVSTVSASLSRTGVAIAALATAFAVALGVDVMTGSFRVAVGDWLQQLMQSDVYISAPAVPFSPLTSAMTEPLAAVSGVAGVSSVRNVTIRSSLGEIELLAMQPADAARPGYRIKDTAPGLAWSKFFREDVVFVSEPFASRHRVKSGDTLRLVTGEGLRDFAVAGVVFDYRSDRGIVLMRRPRYEELWGDPQLSSVGLVLEPGAKLDVVKRELKTVLPSGRGLQIRSNRDIRDSSLALFDRTFAVTGVLRLLAVSVALVGLVGSLLALHLERIREFVILRSLGMTPAQLTGLVLLQSGYIGLCAGLIAMPLGILLAWVLVQVVQFLSFGWTMDMTIPYRTLWHTPGFAVVASLTAGLFPAWRAGRSAPLSALRDE